MRMPARKVPGKPDWAMALLQHGLANGFDFAYSYEIESWDELSVPLHFITPGGRAAHRRRLLELCRAAPARPAALSCHGRARG